MLRTLAKIRNFSYIHVHKSFERTQPPKQKNLNQISLVGIELIVVKVHPYRGYENPKVLLGLIGVRQVAKLAKGVTPVLGPRKDTNPVMI